VLAGILAWSLSSSQVEPSAQVDLIDVSQQEKYFGERVDDDGFASRQTNANQMVIHGHNFIRFPS
jgi:hypothetical protein